jgi:hypothetical protein
VNALTPGPKVQRQAGPCDLVHKWDAATSEAIANVWNIKVISWLKQLDSQATRYAERGDNTLVGGIYSKMQLLNQHFNLSSFLASENKAFPAAAGELSVEIIGPLLTFLNVLRGRFEGLNFFIPVSCLPSCDKEGEGGYALPGSGEFSICLDVYDCQDENGKAYIAFHEVVHATYAESNFDIYISDSGYPGSYPGSIRNPDSLANFAAALNVGKEFAVSICF